MNKKFERGLKQHIDSFMKLRKPNAPPTKWHKDLSKYNRKKKHKNKEE